MCDLMEDLRKLQPTCPTVLHGLHHTHLLSFAILLSGEAHVRPLNNSIQKMPSNACYREETLCLTLPLKVCKSQAYM